MLRQTFSLQKNTITHYKDMTYPTECILLCTVATTAAGVMTVVKPGEWLPHADACPAGDSIRPTQGCSPAALSVD